MKILAKFIMLFALTGVLLGACGGESSDPDTDASLANCDGFSHDVTLDDDYEYDGSDASADAGLGNIECITGGLYISKAAVSSLTGLGSLQRVGFLKIYNNDALTNLYGLDNLTSVRGALRIYNNDALASLHGIGNLTRVGGDLSISENPVLTSLKGLMNLTRVAGVLRIEDNYALPACEADNLASQTSRQCSFPSNCSFKNNNGEGTCP
ncbi:MAG: hypothetical protein GY762_19785 [Proteobacteria bacterium]|nr:hypothetical protein [Pseudomonadota bacterium]